MALSGLGALAALAGEGVAHACSFVPPCDPLPTLGLVGDVTARPTNACIAVQYAPVPWYDESIVPELAYVAADGARIALTATEIPRVYCPAAPLAPDTDHRLVGPRVRADVGACMALEEVELLAFHTGAGPDESPPSRPGEIVDDAGCAREVCDSTACCGPYDTVVHTSSWAPATDDAGEVAYVVDGALRLASTMRWSETSAMQPTLVWVFDRQPHEVRAIDVAGHVSEPATTGPLCVPPANAPPDAGAVDAPALDASAALPDARATDDASIASGHGGGCAAGATRSRAPLVALAALGLALFGRRRRSVSPSRRRSA
ncbi:MAG: hypothetical protein U0353_03720 [Sandaracinus sp.]